MSFDNLSFAHVDTAGDTVAANRAFAAGDTVAANQTFTAASLEANHGPIQGTAAVGAAGAQAENSKSCLPTCTIEDTAAPLGSCMKQSVSGTSDSGQSLATQAIDYAKKHPADTMCFAAGALIGGAIVVPCVPAELAADAVVGIGIVSVGAAGEAALDGLPWLAKKEHLCDRPD